jgi:hypothetical protein
MSDAPIPTLDDSRLLTGDPATGILDWIHAGCPSLGNSEVEDPQWLLRPSNTGRGQQRKGHRRSVDK